jgi:protein-disulfide isomerase
VREHAASTFAVNWTPTFFINGKKISGAVSIDEFPEKVDALLKT